VCVCMCSVCVANAANKHRDCPVQASLATQFFAALSYDRKRAPIAPQTGIERVSCWLRRAFRGERELGEQWNVMYHIQLVMYRRWG
jgi:hypothetical protein